MSKLAEELHDQLSGAKPHNMDSLVCAAFVAFHKSFKLK